jgi:hypothetical protein
VNVVTVSGQTVYVGGSFSRIGDLPQSGFAGIEEDATGVAFEMNAPQSPFARIAPNPTWRPVRVEYSLGREAHVRLRIFDVMGREMVRLMDEVRLAEDLTITWDGEGPVGRVPAGVYFVRLAVPGARA